MRTHRTLSILPLSIVVLALAIARPLPALAQALGPTEHILPDAEGYRPELWSPDGTALVLTREQRDIRILETKSGILWDVYSMAEPSPVRIPMAWDSTGAALRFLDYPAEAIRTYDMKSGELSAFHVRDPFLLREMWRGIEAPETRAITWWDVGSSEWKIYPRDARRAIKPPHWLSSNQMDMALIDLSAEWIVGSKADSKGLYLGPLGTEPSVRSVVPMPLAGSIASWQSARTRLWFAWQGRSLRYFDPLKDWASSADLASGTLGPLTGGQVLHIAIAPDGKRVAWLTATGIRIADIE